MALTVVALAGGVGGAKMADGLAQVLEPSELTVVVNTGDDFDHLGLRICPDLDTVVYTLAGLASTRRGWGRADESWNALNTLGEVGGPTWFRLGDKDLAVHLWRTRRLAEGESLSEFTGQLTRSFQVEPRVLPMTNDRVSTYVETDEGTLSFQEYFVARRCEPTVRGFQFHGAQAAVPAPGVVESLRGAGLIVICPSNPWVSIDPVLSLPGIRESLSGKPVVAVSPLVGGRALKGPAAKMARELGHETSALTVAEHYGSLLTGFVLDAQDRHEEEEIAAMGIIPHVLDTVMKSRKDRGQLARGLLEFAEGTLEGARS